VGLAVGGGAVANAAGSPSIPDRSIQHVDIMTGAVGSDTIANRAIQSVDLNQALVNALRAVPANGVTDSGKVKDGALNESDFDAATKAKLNAVGNGTPGKSYGSDGTVVTDPANAPTCAGKDGAGGKPGLSELEADGPNPGSTDLGSLKDQGDNSDAMAPPDHKSHAVWVQCAPGKVALGGGFRLGAGQGDAVAEKIQVTASEPTQIEDGELVVKPIEGDAAQSIQPNGWLVEVINNSNTDATVRPWVTCAKIG
jgi:hypothetical protein